MQIDKLANSNVCLYRSGMYVISNGVRKGRSPDDLIQICRTKRQYSISRQKVRSACIELFRVKQSKNILFLTYTFAFDISEYDAANVWQNHCDNLKTNYKVKNYVWVKERQKNGRLHFHLLADVRQIPIKKLQNSFNNTVMSICHNGIVSNNSVRLGSNPIIRSLHAIAGYLSKYISKENNNFEKKAFGHTDLILYRKMDFNDFYDLVQGKDTFIYTENSFLIIGIIRNFYDYPSG